MHTFHATAVGADGTLYVRVGGVTYRALDYAMNGWEAKPLVPAPPSDPAGPRTRAELVEYFTELGILSEARTYCDHCQSTAPCRHLGRRAYIPTHTATRCDGTFLGSQCPYPVASKCPIHAS